MRAHPITNLRYSAHGGDVNSSYTPAGEVNVWQRPLPEDAGNSSRILSAALALPTQRVLRGGGRSDESASGGSAAAARAELLAARAEATARALSLAAAAGGRCRGQALSLGQLAQLSPTAEGGAPLRPLALSENSGQPALLARLRAALPRYPC
jgi:hypothetical protein